jgi:S1-C subfamily serine protease
MSARFTMNLLCLIFIVARVGAQTAPPRKNIPTIARAANGAILSIIMSDKGGRAIAQGTGFFVSKDGHVVTNYHVIENGSSAIVKLPDGAFYVVDGVLASDKLRDIAVIKVHGENFRTLTLGNSDRLEIGEEVVAIGNPLSLESTVSNGIVSGIRTVEEKGGKLLQVTTPISPGSSGGPLFNMAGEVIGITTSYLEGGENLNFAIPINDAKRLLLARFSTIQALPNEREPAEAQTHNEEAVPSVSLDQKIACANLVEKAKRGPLLVPGYPAKTSSHFDAQTSICFEIQIQDIPEMKDSDGKIWLASNGKPQATYFVFITDALEGTLYAKLESYSYQFTEDPSLTKYAGPAFVRDTKGNILFPEKNKDWNQMTLDSFRDLVSDKFGIHF